MLRPWPNHGTLWLPNDDDNDDDNDDNDDYNDDDNYDDEQRENTVPTFVVGLRSWIT